MISFLLRILSLHFHNHFPENKQSFFLKKNKKNLNNEKKKLKMEKEKKLNPFLCNAFQFFEFNFKAESQSLIASTNNQFKKSIYNLFKKRTKYLDISLNTNKQQHDLSTK